MLADRPRIGWIGVGRMGFALANRLLDAGHDVAVYNRTRAKADPLADRGAKIVDAPVDLADRDIVFIMVSAPGDLADVTTGVQGLLTHPDSAPAVIIDSSTVSTDASARLRADAARRGAQLLAAPSAATPKSCGRGNSRSPCPDPGTPTTRSNRCCGCSDAA